FSTRFIRAPGVAAINATTSAGPTTTARRHRFDEKSATAAIAATPANMLRYPPREYNRASSRTSTAATIAAAAATPREGLVTSTASGTGSAIANKSPMSG